METQIINEDKHVEKIFRSPTLETVKMVERIINFVRLIVQNF